MPLAQAMNLPSKEGGSNGGGGGDSSFRVWGPALTLISEVDWKPLVFEVKWPLAGAQDVIDNNMKLTWSKSMVPTAILKCTGKCRHWALFFKGACQGGPLGDFFFVEGTGADPGQDLTPKGGGVPPPLYRRLVAHLLLVLLFGLLAEGESNCRLRGSSRLHSRCSTWPKASTCALRA